MLDDILPVVIKRPNPEEDRTSTNVVDRCLMFQSGAIESFKGELSPECFAAVLTSGTGISSVATISPRADGFITKCRISSIGVSNVQVGGQL